MSSRLVRPSTPFPRAPEGHALVRAYPLTDPLYSIADRETREAYIERRPDSSSTVSTDSSYDPAQGFASYRYPSSRGSGYSHCPQFDYDSDAYEYVDDDLRHIYTSSSMDAQPSGLDAPPTWDIFNRFEDSSLDYDNRDIHTSSSTSTDYLILLPPSSPITLDSFEGVRDLYFYGNASDSSLPYLLPSSSTLPGQYDSYVPQYIPRPYSRSHASDCSTCDFCRSPPTSCWDRLKNKVGHLLITFENPSAVLRKRKLRAQLHAEMTHEGVVECRFCRAHAQPSRLDQAVERVRRPFVDAKAALQWKAKSGRAKMSMRRRLSDGQIAQREADMIALLARHGRFVEGYNHLGEQSDRERVQREAAAFAAQREYEEMAAERDSVEMAFMAYQGQFSTENRRYGVVFDTDRDRATYSGYY